MDALGIPFVLACLVVYFTAVLLLARFCGQNERLSQRQREELAERRELEGPWASVADFAAEREARVNRAQFRHHTRWGRAS